MSGYLQRLVSAVAGGGDVVRPRTGSIFSPRVEETPAPAHDSRHTEHATVPAPRARLAPASPPAADLAGPANPVVRGSGPTPPTPLFPTASEATVAPPIEAAPLLVRAASPPDVETVVPADESAREPVEAFPVFATKSREIDPRVRSADPARRSSGRQDAQRERQPDDIQIHIGRIEVIAVPPPAPRAPKAPDRSVSLEAYLNRRDRRPR